jgi:hypothetical protein
MRCILADMVPDRGGSPARVTLWLSVAVYVLFLVASPWLHHDTECHVKTPSHCGACMASPLGLGAAVAAAVNAFHLPDAGDVKAISVSVHERIFAVDTPGRAPPA